MPYFILDRNAHTRLCLLTTFAVVLCSSIVLADSSESPSEQSGSDYKTNGLSLMAIVQGIGPEVGMGIAMQTPRYLDFLALRLSLSSSSQKIHPNTYVSWTDVGTDVLLTWKVQESSSIRPYIALEFAKALGTAAGINKSSLAITSWGYRYGIEVRLLVRPTWGEERHTGLLFLEAGPQISSLQRFDDTKVNDGFLVKIGVGYCY